MCPVLYKIDCKKQSFLTNLLNEQSVSVASHVDHSFLWVQLLTILVPLHLTLRIGVDDANNLRRESSLIFDQ